MLVINRHACIQIDQTEIDQQTVLMYTPTRSAVTMTDTLFIHVRACAPLALACMLLPV